MSTPERTREELLHETEILKQRYGALYERMLEVFFSHDPVGLGMVHNSDEYAPEVRAVLKRLDEVESAEQLRRVIYEEFCRLFSDDEGNVDEDVGAEERYAPIAEEVWSVIRRPDL